MDSDKNAPDLQFLLHLCGPEVSGVSGDASLWGRGCLGLSWAGVVRVVTSEDPSLMQYISPGRDKFGD